MRRTSTAHRLLAIGLSLLLPLVSAGRTPAAAAASSRVIPPPPTGLHMVHTFVQEPAMCMTVLNVSTADNAPVVQYGCEFALPHNEHWYLERVRPGVDDWMHLRNGHSGKCLTIQNVSVANNAPAVQYTCESSAPYNEEWRIASIDGSTYYEGGVYLQNRHSTKCLTVFGALSTNNVPLVQYDCLGERHSKWRLFYL